MKLLVVEGLYKPVLDKRLKKQFVHQYGEIFDFDKVSRTLENFTRKNKIAFLSLPRLLQDSAVQVETLFYPRENIHVNKEGIAFSAHAIVEKLYSLLWISPAS